MAQKLDKAGKHRDDDDSEYYKSEVLLDDRQVAEIISPEYKNSNPGCACGNVINRKTPVCHKTETCYKRRKRSDYGNEPS